MPRLPDPSYLQFPFQLNADGPVLSDRARHVRDQIEQTLLTAAGERVFRPDFGVGLRQLLFEPNTSALWAITEKRMASALMEALQGEVDPGTLSIQVRGEEERLVVSVSYTLARLDLREEHQIVITGGPKHG